MKQTEARARAQLYKAHGIDAVARKVPAWADDPTKPWRVDLKARDGEYYYEYDVRVSIPFNKLHDALREEEKNAG